MGLFNIFRGKEPKKGCIVYCDLAVVVEHSGIYVGGGKIVHLVGDGEIEIVTPKEFIARLGGLNPADKIYYSCDEYGDPIKSKKIANRAKNMVGKGRDYNWVWDNCHQFTSGCITGDFNNADNAFWMLKDTAKKELGVKGWRIWEF